jgi:hypothetical protein
MENEGCFFLFDCLMVLVVYFVCCLLVVFPFFAFKCALRLLYS